MKRPRLTKMIRGMNILPMRKINEAWAGSPWYAGLQRAALAILFLFALAGPFSRLSAAVMNLAVQRALTISESQGKVYTLTKGDGSQLDGAETRLLEALFKGGSQLILVQANHSTLAAARSVLAKDLAIQVGPCFASNTGVWVVGLLSTLIPLGISLLDVRNKQGTLFMMVWLSIWSLGCAALSFSVFNAWQSKNKLAAIPLTLFSIPFLAGWFFGLWMLMQFASPWVCEIYVSGPSAAGLVLPLAIASSFSSSFTSAISSASTAPGSSSGSGGGGSSGGGGGGGW